MKKLLVIFLLASTFCFGQRTIKIAYLGNSHCNGCCEANQADSAWVPLVSSFFKKYYDTVRYQRYCDGGETIVSGMWDGFTPQYGSVQTTRNISRALEYNPDIYIIEYSGNHFAFGYPLWYVKQCFSQLADTLFKLNKRFVFVGGTPRQKTFASQAVQTAYMDTTRQFNSWLASTFPNNFVPVYDSLVDIARDSPRVNVLGNDKLHWNTLGHLTLASDIFKAKVVDTLLNFYSGYMLNFRPVKTGGVVYLNGTPRCNKILVSGGLSANGSFTPVKYFINCLGGQLSFPAPDYPYLCFQFWVGRSRPLTVTFRVN